MISYLQGPVRSFDGRSVLVAAGAVGYRVTVPVFVLEGMKEGKELELYCYTKLDTRNNTIELYGFPTAEELHFFELLLSITGVGPRSAMGALSVAKLEDLKRTIAQGNAQLLQKVAGIGKKTAERIVVELKDKMGEIVGGAAGVDAGDRDVVDALKGLGYREREVIDMLKELPKELEGSEARVKEVLKRIGRKRK